MRDSNKQLKEVVDRISASYLEEITRLKAVIEPFASVASEEGVREMLRGYVQGAMALEALEKLKGDV
jgi:hypothetical protein